MALQSIGQVSKQFNISVRTLRYYEEIGLITAIKKTIPHIGYMMKIQSYGCGKSLFYANSKYP